MIGIYARVSTEEQAKHGYSLTDQIRQCQEKAASHDIKDYIDDGISGEFLDRPALTKLRQDAKDGIITKVVCLDPDRLSRKLMNQLIITDEFDKRGVELVFVNGEYAKTPEGNLFYSMRGAIAEFEKSKINERMSRGRKEKARQGKVVKNNYVFGYNYDKEKGQLIINEDESGIVKMIFDLFTQPNNEIKGVNGIALLLTDKKIPTKLGKSVWHRQVVRQILMNRTYTGINYQNKWNTEGMLGNKHRGANEKVPMKLRPKEDWIGVECPEIISEFQFEHAQRLLGESKRRHAKASINSYLLSGLIRCGECGNTMTGRKSMNWGKSVFEYSDYKNTAGAKHRGCGMKVNAADIEESVWESVRNWLNQPDEIAAATEQETTTTYEESEIERIQKDIERTRAARKRLIKLYSAGLEGISEEEIREELKELSEREETLNGQLAELKEILENADSSEYSINILQEAAEYYLTKNQNELTFEDKKDLIRRVVREIRIYKDEKVEILGF